MTNAIKPGAVVHFKASAYGKGKKTRRYVVGYAYTFGIGTPHETTDYSLYALSGGKPGCQPTGVRAEMVELDADQTVDFTGAEAAYLKRHLAEGLASAHASKHYAIVSNSNVRYDIMENK